MNNLKKEIQESKKKITKIKKNNTNNSTIKQDTNIIKKDTNIIKQEKGLKRNIIDKYYTKPDVVKQCIELVKKYINILDTDLIIEPSAGNGSFIENIKTLSSNYKFYDLEPEHNEIIKQNFLEFDYINLKEKFKNIHIIGNPPFGRQASMAIKFIKKCSLFSNSISFILPKSFKKESMKKCFEKHYHLIYEIDLLENSFLVNNIESNVPCVFQIWQYKEEIRNEIDKKIPLNFKFVGKKDNPDISFRRVGVNAGTIMKEINNKSFQSHYFIKFTNNITIDENIEKLKLIKFNFNNTVGPKSISKPELIDEFNNLLI
jgi:predicted RNA methylase